MKDLPDDLREFEAKAAPASPPPAAAALAARQAAGGTAPDTKAFLAAFVGIAEIAAPSRATPLFAPEEEAAVIAELIEEMRPMFRRDGGDIEFLDIAGATVRVRLSGSCAGCLLSGRTLATVQRQLVETLGRPVRVVPEVSH